MLCYRCFSVIIPKFNLSNVSEKTVYFWQCIQNSVFNGHIAEVPDHIVHKVQNIELVVYPARNGRLGCSTQR